MSNSQRSVASCVTSTRSRRSQTARRFAFALVLVLNLFGGPRRAHAEAPAELLTARGILLYRQGELAGAVTLLQRAWTQPQAPLAAGHHLGLALLGLGQKKEGRRVLVATLRRISALRRKRPSLFTRVSRDLALAYLSEGNAAWAVRTLRRALRQAPRDGELRYHLGVALLKLGQANEAARELGRVGKTHAVRRDDVRLHRALAYYLDQRWEAARLQLTGLLSGSRGTLANQLLRASYAAEGTSASWVSATLSLGFVADGNPLYEHETTSPAGLGPSFSGSLVMRPWVDARNLAWAEAAAQRVSYFPAATVGVATDPRDGSFTDLRAGLFYGRRIPAHALQLSLGYRAGVTLLDGEPPLAGDNHVFVESHTGIVALQHGDNAAATQLRFSVGRAEYALQARGNTSNELWLEHMRTLAGDRLRLLGFGLARYEAANSARYDAVVLGAGLGASYLAPLKLLLGVRAAYRFTDYYASAVAYDDRGGLRRDYNIDLTGEVSRALFAGLRLRAAYRYLRNISRVTDFDYDRHLFTFDVSWSYQ